MVNAFRKEKNASVFPANCFKVDQANLKHMDLMIGSIHLRKRYEVSKTHFKAIDTWTEASFSAYHHSNVVHLSEKCYI